MRSPGGWAGGCGSRIMIGAGNSDEACALLGLAEPTALSIPRAAWFDFPRCEAPVRYKRFAYLTSSTVPPEVTFVTKWKKVRFRSLGNVIEN